MAEQLYGVAIEYAGLRGHEKVFDLYCGIGTIALSLATRARQVIGLEIVEPAVADAIENARINEIQNATFYAGDARLALRELVEREGKPDLAIIDPPRAGLSQKIVRRIVEAAPSRIVYVSCNPTTLAPNAAQLVEAGYRLDQGPPGRHVPADPAHRVRGAAGSRPGRRPEPRPRRLSGLGAAERRDLAERGRAWIVGRGWALGGLGRLHQLALRLDRAPFARGVELDLELQRGWLAGALTAGGLVSGHANKPRRLAPNTDRRRSRSARARCRARRRPRR